MPDKEQEERPLTIIVAMGANLSIAVAKFVVAAVSGSSAMFAEGVHSVVDTLNQGLLLIGAKRAHRVPDDVHPFGYGKEIYFWTVIYSVLLLGIGGGVSIFKGVIGVVEPEPVENFAYSYAVLGVALLAEGVSWLFALRMIKREVQGTRLWQKLRNSSDPSRFVVLGEDSAALIGVVVAAIGIGLSQWLGTSIPDSVASILIGFVLCVAAVLLISKTKELTVGQAAPRQVVVEVMSMIEGDSRVHYTRPPLTMQLGPEQTMVAIDVRFDAQLDAPGVAQAIDDFEKRIRKRFPHFTRIYIEPQAVSSDVDREQPDQQAQTSQ